MIRHLQRWGIVALMAITFLVYIIESRTHFSYKIYQVKNGYGYHIKQGDKIIIQQDFIPTKRGHQAFEIKQHAEEAAKLVVKKLKQNQVPALTTEEINNIFTQ